MATKSVILLDFDNIFLGLWKLDRELALRFGQTPLEWLSLLADRHLTLVNRRWLVARCYLNPAGWVDAPGETSGRFYLSRFRPALVRAGFEVIDCPGLTREGKNAADIRLVIDALDLLKEDCFYEEYVIASGDADFTPLVHRLRANDRRVTIVSSGYSASAYTSLADRIVGFEALEALILPEQALSPPTVSSSESAERGNDVAEFLDYVRDRLLSSIAPLNLANLAHDVARTFPDARASGWFGAGSFSNAIAQLELPHVRLSQHFVWDEERHAPPAGSGTTVDSDAPPEIVLLRQTVDLPRLTKGMWRKVFAVLARYADEYEFNLTEATRWARDTLASEGCTVSRVAVSYIVRGVQFGGVSLDRDPAPDADEIAAAFLAQLLDRARRLGMDISLESETVIARWFEIDPPTNQSGKDLAPA